jgi:hypothetical protein
MMCGYECCKNVATELGKNELQERLATAAQTMLESKSHELRTTFPLSS